MLSGDTWMAKGLKRNHLLSFLTNTSTLMSFPFAFSVNDFHSSMSGHTLTPLHTMSSPSAEKRVTISSTISSSSNDKGAMFTGTVTSEYSGYILGNILLSVYCSGTEVCLHDMSNTEAKAAIIHFLIFLSPLCWWKKLLVDRNHLADS